MSKMRIIPPLFLTLRLTWGAVSPQMRLRIYA